jgi:hypothetical protein
MTISRFPTLDDLRDAHKDGNIALSDELTVDGVLFHFRKASTHPFNEILTQNKYGVVIYAAGHRHREEAKTAGLNEWIVLMWKAFQNRIIPVGVTTTDQQRGYIYEQDENIIGDTVEVKFTNLPSTTALKGRVDTGATISSLHADSVQVQNGKVRFICKQLSPNVLTMDMADKQLVNSPDGGNEYRPVVELNVAVNGKVMQGMMFNLNDRSKMEHPVLIGQNVLEKGGFLINPQLENAEPDWDAFIESLEFEEFEEVVPEDKTEQITELLTLLSNADITFEELMRHMRTDAVEVMEKIEY